MYRLVRKKGMRCLRLQVRPDAYVIYAPRWIPQYMITAFWNQHKEQLPPLHEHYQELYYQYKEEARSRIQNRVIRWAEEMKLSYNRIAIKNTRTRWGSCSEKGNLNFCYKVAFLPEKLQDYIVVHELSHLIYLNHSSAFWRVVETYLPDYRERKTQLRQCGNISEYDIMKVR